MITRDLILDDAQLLGVEPACVLAVAEVESAGSGFLPDGRPTILFEAQWFHTFTKGVYDQSYPNISSPVWDRSLYIGGAREYLRLGDALKLNPPAALKSASLGAFQIMGFNYQAAGFASVDGFVEAMKKDLNSQIEAFTAFVRYNPELLQALRAKDWVTFARIYNGPGAVAQYSAKIETAYQMYAKRDAAYLAAVPPPPEAPPVPNFEGAPIPTADPSAPPAGYVANPTTGNLVRENVEDSSIVKGAKVGQVVTATAGAATAVTAAVTQAKGALSGITDVGAICLTVITLALIGCGFWYFRRVGRDRRDMHDRGIA